jgi:hypothetical protein
VDRELFAAGREYACDPGAEDLVGPPQCAEGWRCGAQGACVEDAPGGGAACVRDADCAGGWQCGRDNLCRNPGVNAPYACLDDRDCGPSWVCGLEGRCIDPLAAAASPADPHALLEAGERLSPARTTAPDAFSLALAPTSRPEYTLVLAEARAEGAALSTWTVPQRPPRSNGSPFGELVASLPFEPAPPRRAPLPGAPRAVAALWPDGALALLPGGLYGTDGGTAVALEPRLAGLERLAVVAPGGEPLLTAWSPAQVATGTLRDGGVLLSPLAAGGAVLAGGPGPDADQRLGEVGLYRNRNAVADDYLVATTERGLYARSTLAGAPWQPVALGGLSHADCPAQGGELRAVDVVSTGAGSTYLLTLVARPAGGGEAPYGVQLGSGQSTGAPCTGARGPFAFTATAPACPLCPAGARLVDARVQPLAGPAVLQTRCAGGAGGERSFTVTLAAPCALAELSEAVGTAATAPTRAVREARAFATADGRLFGGGVGPVSAPAVLLPEAPAELVRVRGVLSASAPARLTERTEYVEVEGLGLVRTFLNDLRPLPTGRSVTPRFVLDRQARAVREARGWEDGGSPPVVAVLEPSVLEGLQLPASADASPRPDGGTTLVVTSFDTVLSADVSGPPPAAGGAPPRLVPRLSPRPRTALRAVALATPAAGALAEGYALTASGVVHFRALSDQRWEARELRVPEGPWLTLWREEGGGVQLGLADGRVYALPGRLQLADALPGGATVTDFARVCGRTYAAGSAGLLRLEPRGASGGAWVPEPRFEALRARVRPEDLPGARLFTGARELFWAGAGGTLLRFAAGAGCPATPEAP